MSRALENMSVVAVLTLLSRVLGLLRDVLLFSFLGTSPLNSAFLFAFTIPNLFRRLLGEGALTSALVPVLAVEFSDAGEAGGFILFNRVFCRVALVLAVLAAVGCAALAIAWRWEGLDGRWRLAAGLGVILLPYMFFVCLAALVGAGLNVLGRFAVPALAQVWLNLAMILSLGVFAAAFSSSAGETVAILCGGVLVGGGMQLIIPAVSLRKEGWRLQLDLGSAPGLEQVWRLLLPGLAGAAVVQINVAVSRLIAYGFSGDAVAVLYLANRLIELPLGVFVISVTTVAFPELSRLAAGNHEIAFGEAYSRGMRLIIAITLPAAAGLMLLREPVLNCLFLWGSFGNEDVSRTASVLGVFALGLPFYAASILSIRGFHALKDMRTPMCLAGLNFVLNIGFTLVLMRLFGLVGFAVANVAAMVVHSILLHSGLVRKRPYLVASSFFRPLGGILLAVIGMSAFTIMGRVTLAILLPDPKWVGAAVVLALIPASVGIYLLLLNLVRFEDAAAMREIVRKVIRI